MHEPVVERLEEYIQGGGPYPEVEEHLSKCAECREELDSHESAVCAVSPGIPVGG